MNYFFPNPFIGGEKHRYGNDIGLEVTIDSGKSAIQQVLRSFNLDKYSKIGIPAFCCSSLQRAITDEKLVPFFFDFIDSKNYWADYSIEQIKKNDIKVVILTHLYGFIHPDTKKIVKFSHENGVRIIHDVAQSFGIDVSLFGHDPIIYSFGPGKSTTAALGGEIVGLNINGKYPKPGLGGKLYARLFFRSRLIGASNRSLVALLMKYLAKRVSNQGGFSDMSKYQKKCAMDAKYITLYNSEDRKLRYNLIFEALKQNEKLSVPFYDESCLCFKIVIYVSDDVERFVSFLNENMVPFYRLSNDIDPKGRDKDNLPFFYKSFRKFIEISTERSLPLTEIERVSSVLKKYK